MKKTSGSQSGKKAWKKWNRRNRPPRLSAEQTLVWLDGFRRLMSEVWKKNPSLRRQRKKADAIFGS